MRYRGMSIVSLLIVLILIGAGLYLIKLVPMDPRIRTIVTTVAIVALIIWLLRNFAPSMGLT